MKPRPVPTSPKEKNGGQGIEAIYGPNREIVRPASGTAKAVFLATLLSTIIVVGAVVGLFWLARRYPQHPFLRLFVLEAPSRESIVIREQPQDQQRRIRELAKKVAGSLGTLVAKGTGDFRPPSDRRGLVALVSSDGVGIALKNTIPSHEQLTVESADGAEAPVNAVASDPASPLILARVSGSTTALPIGDIDDLMLGSDVWVVRFDPFAGGLGVVETKIIALRDRPIDGETMAALLESSEIVSRRVRLAVSLDNSWSGAAVIDVNGRLIGLFEAGSGSQTGLVVPVNILRNQLSRFSRGESIRRPVLGIHYVDLAYTSTPKFPNKGAYISGNDAADIPAVEPNTPAAAAGLRSDDIITALDATPVNDFHALSEILATYDPGAKVTLEILRVRESLKVDVTLGVSEATT